MVIKRLSKEIWAWIDRVSNQKRSTSTLLGLDRKSV